MTRRWDNRPQARSAGWELIRFAIVGGMCTALYLLLYVSFRIVLGAQPANLVALFLSSLANTALNRRVTFSLAGRAATGEYAKGLVAFAVGAALTSAGLAVLDWADPHPTERAELAVLLSTTALATIVRYVMFRRWVFRTALGRQ